MTGNERVGEQQVSPLEMILIAKAEVKKQEDIVEYVKDPNKNITQLVAEYRGLSDIFKDIDLIKRLLNHPTARENICKYINKKSHDRKREAEELRDATSFTYFPAIVEESKDNATLTEIASDMLYRIAPNARVQEVLLKTDEQLMKQWANYHASMQGKADYRKGYNFFLENEAKNDEDMKFLMETAVSMAGGDNPENPVFKCFTAPNTNPEEAKKEFDKYLGEAFKQKPDMPKLIAQRMYTEGLGTEELDNQVRKRYAAMLAQKIQG